MLGLIEKTAIFSPCRTWRYMLSRTWNKNKPCINFIGLNPSTADEKIDDPTIRRCTSYAQNWGFGSLVMTNIFAFRSTNPKNLFSATDPIGPENDIWLVNIANEAKKIIVAWGTYGDSFNRNLDICKLLWNLRSKTYCFGLTKNHQPKHPLYLRKNEEIVLFENII